MATKQPAAKSGRKERPRLTTPEGIVCFEHVWEAAAMEEGKQKKFSLILVFPNKAILKELRQQCIATATAKFGEDWRKLHEKGKFRFPWRDGDEYEDYGAPFTNEGAVFCSFQSTTPVGVVDGRAKPIMDRADFYSGALARVTYTPWAYDSNGNKGVTLLLNNVQKTGKGERIAGKPNAEDDFEAVEDGDDGIEEDGDDNDI